MSLVQLQNSRIDTVVLPTNFHTSLDVLRLDLVHPVISGNKWFKLQQYLEEAKSLHKKTIATFGGPYSNHIVATAAAARQEGLQSIGLIRGEESWDRSPTLGEAAAMGMQLQFLSREDYRQKKIPAAVAGDSNSYLIPEGGYGPLGAKGAEGILNGIDISPYTHLLAAVGTGTTVAGLARAAMPHQSVIGISVFKNHYGLQSEIEALLDPHHPVKVQLVHDYSFGGYAKASQELFDFMNGWFRRTAIPSDRVYTGKLFYAVDQLIQKDFFPDDSRILAIHTGGLQGNRSLPKGTLIF